jgi:hypothetical protein
MNTDSIREQETKVWAAKRFNIQPEEVRWYNSGICYDRIGVTTKEAADKVTETVKGETVNGGMFHGMRLGSQTKTEYGFDVMC